MSLQLQCGPSFRQHWAGEDPHRRTLAHCSGVYLCPSSKIIFIAFKLRALQVVVSSDDSKRELESIKVLLGGLKASA